MRNPRPRMTWWKEVVLYRGKRAGTVRLALHCKKVKECSGMGFGYFKYTPQIFFLYFFTTSRKLLVLWILTTKYKHFHSILQYLFTIKMFANGEPDEI